MIRKVKHPGVGPITLRNLPPEVARRIRLRATEKGISLNRAVIELLEESLGLRSKGPRVYHDLDFLAGTWTKEEADEFNLALAELRRKERAGAEGIPGHPSGFTSGVRNAPSEQ